MGQPTLFDRVNPAPAPRFDGPDVTPADTQRLAGHLARVRALMADGQWRTLAAIAAACGCSEASASARLRDLRKRRHGSHVIARQRTTQPGLFLYRMVCDGRDD